MDLPRTEIDPDGLLEFSVVFTDRSLNHMSAKFVAAAQSLLEILRTTYAAEAVALVPGGGSYAMESVARQFATGRRVLIVRNGLFSFRWSQILETGAITDQIAVCAARPADDSIQAPFSPAPIEEVVARIHEVRPEVVFAPHVETAAGIVLPDDYLRQLAAAVHEVGGLFVLDCIASGALWIDMADLGVDVLISAPQKGWSGTPCTGYVMLGPRGLEAVDSTTSSSFAMDLGKWLAISQAYVDGLSPYHATLPTDSIAANAVIAAQTRDRGLDTLRASQVELGQGVRSLLASRGFNSVAAAEFASPTVVVVHTTDPELKTGAKFKQTGLQVAAGVPLHCGERDDFSSFRLGLFGLDKLDDVAGTVARLAEALSRVLDD